MLAPLEVQLFVTQSYWESIVQQRNGNNEHVCKILTPSTSVKIGLSLENVKRVPYVNYEPIINRHLLGHTKVTVALSSYLLSLEKEKDMSLA